MSHSYITAAQLAERLEVSPRTIKRWTSRREIPHIRRGRILRYSVEDVEAWLARETVRPLRQPR